MKKLLVALLATTVMCGVARANSTGSDGFPFGVVRADDGSLVNETNGLPLCMKPSCQHYRELQGSTYHIQSDKTMSEADKNKARQQAMQHFSDQLKADNDAKTDALAAANAPAREKAEQAQKAFEAEQAKKHAEAVQAENARQAKKAEEDNEAKQVALANQAKEALQAEVARQVQARQDEENAKKWAAINAQIAPIAQRCADDANSSAKSKGLTVSVTEYTKIVSECAAEAMGEVMLKYGKQ